VAQAYGDPRLTVAQAYGDPRLTVARLRAWTYRGFCSGLPGLLEAMMRLCSGLPRLLCSMHAVAYVCSMHAEAYAWGGESLVLESCRVCSRHDETFVFFFFFFFLFLVFFVLKLFSGGPPIVET
jgi:hypothetical protein